MGLGGPFAVFGVNLNETFEGLEKGGARLQSNGLVDGLDRLAPFPFGEVEIGAAFVEKGVVRMPLWRRAISVFPRAPCHLRAGPSGR